MNPTKAELEALFNRLADGIASEADEQGLSELLRSGFDKFEIGNRGGRPIQFGLNRIRVDGQYAGSMIDQDSCERHSATAGINHEPSR